MFPISLRAGDEVATLRRAFRDDFLDVLDGLVKRGVITAYESDIDEYGPVHGLHLLVTAAGLTNGADVASLRDKVRQELADLTDNIVIVVNHMRR